MPPHPPDYSCEDPPTFHKYEPGTFAGCCRLQSPPYNRLAEHMFPQDHFRDIFQSFVPGEVAGTCSDGPPRVEVEEARAHGCATAFWGVGTARARGKVRERACCWPPITTLRAHYLRLQQPDMSVLAVNRHNGGSVSSLTTVGLNWLKHEIRRQLARTETSEPSLGLCLRTRHPV